MLSWLNKDGKLLLASRITRGIGYGFLSVVLAIYLNLLGFGEVQIGIILTGTLASSAVFTLLAGILERRVGRKTMLSLFAVLMSAAGTVFVISTDYAALLFAALVGTINVTGTEVGPFLAVEQAIIPQTCVDEKKSRTLAFAWYSTGGTVATSAGALIAGLPAILQTHAGLDTVASFKPLFGLYVAIGVLALLLYRCLSSGVEVQESKTMLPRQVLLSPQSRRAVTRLSGLFALDSFAGGFVVQSITAYWFFLRFGAPLAQLSVIFFVAGMLTATSYLLAARLANKMGLVRTMVFTHLPSNILLMLVPLAPGLPSAMGLYLARMSLSQMDVPTRQSYTVAIVSPEERVAAAGFTNVSRSIAQSISPYFSSYLLQFLSYSLPFFLGGALKIIYDVSLYANFRKLKAPEEEEESERRIPTR